MKEITPGKEKAKRGHSQRWRPGEALYMDLRVCGATGFTSDVEFHKEKRVTFKFWLFYLVVKIFWLTNS